MKSSPVRRTGELLGFSAQKMSSSTFSGARSSSWGFLRQYIHVLEGGGVVGAVHNALVADDFVVHILVLDGLAVAVKLHHAPLGAEGEEDRQIAEACGG